MLEKIREELFWALDNIKGAKIKKSYELIKKFDHTNSLEKEIVDYQIITWNELKTHACQTTDFYKEYLQKDFFDFPIINKNIIRENQSSFFSKKFQKDSLIQMATSGSTGTPFICYQDINKKRRVNAEIIYYSEKIGYKVGKNLSYIRTVVKQNRKSSFKQFLQNQTLIQCASLSDIEIQNMVDDIKKYGARLGTTLLGYGSTYTAMKDYFIKKGIDNLSTHGVTGIISGSDMLYDETRKTMENVFRCQMVSRYSNEENGVLGQDEGINNVFTINEADYLVEIIDNEGKNVPDGTIGRIVVTDLFNYAMPMIRYDTGDAGAIEILDINGRKKRVISHFSGRITDLIFDVEGNALSPHTITNCMWSFPDVRQFQLIQKEKKFYLLKINVDENFERKDELIHSFKNILGSDAIIQLEKVNEIPVLKSGKRRYVVNEYL